MLETVTNFISHLDTAGWAGVLAATVLVFDRLAKVIPTQSTSKVAQVLHKICVVLGVKVPDVQ